jgi:hypothetical protein
MHPESGDSGSAAPRFRRPSGAVVTLGVGLIWTTVLLLVQARDLYFFADDWVFIVSRDAHWPGLLEPYNGHWSTTLILAMRGLLRVVGLGHYLPYAAIPIGSHLIGTVSLYVVLRRIGARPWPAAVSTLLVGLGVGFLAVGLLWIAVTGFIGAVGFTTAGLALYLSLTRPLIRFGATWVALLLGLMCSAMASVMLVWVALVVVAVDGWRRSLLVVGPPGALLAGWLLAFRGDVADAETGPTSLGQAADFVATGLQAAWASVLPGDGALAGAVVMIALALAALFAPVPRPLRVAALAGLAALLLLFVLLARTRAGLGVSEAGAPRYAYAGLFLTIPALTVLGQWLADRVADRSSARPVVRVLPGLVGGLVLAFAAVNGFANIDRVAGNRTFLYPQFDQTVRAAADLAASQEPVLTYNAQGRWSGIDVEDLTADPYLGGRLPGGPVSNLSRLRAALGMQVAVQPYSLGLPAAQARAGGVSISSPDASGCVRLTVARAIGILDLPPIPGGSQVGLVVDDGVRLRVQAVRGDLETEQVGIPVTAGERLVVGSVMPGATLRVVIVGSGGQLCEGAADTRSSPAS